MTPPSPNKRSPALGGGPDSAPLDLTRLGAELEARVARLEQLVAGLSGVLDRFEAGVHGEEPADILGDFGAPDVSH